MRPFSRQFLPVLQEIRQLPHCSDIHVIFNKIVTDCDKDALSFGQQAYNEYANMKTEVKAFLELLPDKWESLSLQQCIPEATCLSSTLKNQAQSVSNGMQKLKNKFHDFDFKVKLKMCKETVEEVSKIFGNVKNITKFVKEFSFKDDIVRIKDLSRKITGKYFDDDDESQVSYMQYHF